MFSDKSLKKTLKELGFIKFHELDTNFGPKLLTSDNQKDGKPYLLACYNTSKIDQIDQAKIINFVEDCCTERYPSAIAPQKAITTNNHLVVIYPYFSSLTLSQFQKENYFSITNGIKWALALTDAVNKLHQLRLSHLSISPDVCFIDPDNKKVKFLLLCGLANFDQKPLLSNKESHTTSAIYCYRSPEQCGLKNTIIDYRSDYYSLGMTFYKIFTDRHPFSTNKTEELIHLQKTMVPRKIQEVNPRIPHMVAAVVHKLLQKMPHQRYQNGYVLYKDLQRCLENYQHNASVEKFELAKKDTPLYLRIPQQLYGRKKELKIIKKIINAPPHNEIISLSGPSGIGKSALLKVVKNSAEEKEWLHLSAKGDFKNNDKPSGLFSQILINYVNLAVLDPKKKQNEREKELTKILGENAGLLQVISPEANQLFGYKLAHTELDEKASKELLEDTFCNFIAYVASKSRGLVVVLDDLQWADETDLQLLSKLGVFIRDNSIPMLLVGSYHNDTEYKKTVSSIFQDHKNKDSHFHTLEPNKLDKKEILEFISNTLPLDKTTLGELSNEVFIRSQGNPYFIFHYLKYLLEKQILFFDPVDMKWNMLNNQFIKSKDIFELLKVRIEKLPQQTKNILYDCSFFGSHIKKDDLIHLCEYKKNDVEAFLQPAINSDLIHVDENNINFKHDQVLQYFMNMGTKKKRTKSSYEIGWGLWKRDKKDQHNFETIKFLNQSISICNDKEKAIIQKLNLKCATISINNNAFSLAYSLASTAQNLLRKLKKKPSNKLIFDTELLFIKSSYLSSHYKKAIAHTKKLLKQKLSFKQKALLFSLTKDIYTNKGENFNYVVALGTSVAHDAGFKIPKQEEELLELNKELENTINTLYLSKGISAFKKIPNTINPDTSLKYRLLMDLWEAAYYAGDVSLMSHCGLLLVSQSLKTGYVSESAFGFAILASIYTSQKKYTQAHDFGSWGLSINRNFKDQLLLPKVSNIFCNYTNFFKNPFSNNLELYDKSAYVARRNSDYLFGIWAVFFRIWSGIICGEPIRESLAKLDEYSNFIRQTNDKKMEQACEMLRTFLTSFQSNHQKHSGIFDARSHPKAMLQLWQKEGFKPGIIWYAIIKAQALFLNSNYQGALDALNTYGKEASLDIVMFPITQYHYIYALSILKLKDKAKNLTEPWQDIVEKHRTIIAEWAATAPKNFKYQLHLIDAFLAEANDDQWVAYDHFKKAIHWAKKSQSPLNIALCNELTAEFWLNQGDETISNPFLMESFSAYRQWGAKRKLFELESKQPNTMLFTHDRNPEPISVNIKDNLKQDNFDNSYLSELLRQIKVLTMQTEEGGLFETLLTFLIEQTGAQRAVLIKDIGSEPFVVCITQGYPANPITLIHPIPLRKYNKISKDVVMNIRNNGAPQLLHQATKSGAFKSDPYIKKEKIKSILALPIDQNRPDLGVVYIENALISHAFNNHHLKIAQTLNSQMLISLENSELYQNLLLQIKERENVEKQLRISEERMRLGVILGKIGLWEWNLRTDKLYWSEEAVKLLGFKDQNTPGSYKNFLKHLHPDDKEKVISVIQECLDGHKKDFFIEHRVIWEDGSTHTLEARGGALRDGFDKAYRIFGVVQDKTEQRLMEEQISHGKRMSSLEILTGGIAHDFNNLLGVIVGYGQLLKGSKISEAQEEHLVHILDASRRGARLTKKLLSLVGADDIETRSYNINVLLEGSYDVLSKTLTSACPLSYNLQPHKGRININIGDFNDVILNLVVNSKLAMPGGGRMSVNTFTTSELETIDTLNRQLVGEHVAIEFVDSGTGIPPEIVSRVIEPFFSTRKEDGGTGLGLSQVYAFVQRANGGMTIQSKPSSGTKITLYFPLIHGGINHMDNKKIPSKPEMMEKSSHANVLIVEDEESLAKLIMVMLGNLGFNSTWLNNPDDVIQYLHENKDIDIVITDLVMPGTLNGSELIENIHAKFPTIKCQLMSGYISPEVLNSLEKDIRKNILAKPFTQEELGDALHKHQTSEPILN